MQRKQTIRQALEARLEEAGLQTREHREAILNDLSAGRNAQTLEKERKAIDDLLERATSYLHELQNFLGAREIAVLDDGQRSDKHDRERVIGLAQQVYEPAAVAAAMRHDADGLLAHLLRPSSSDVYVRNRRRSLLQHVEAHFILAELYTILQIRKEAAVEEYKLVIEKGETLYQTLVRQTKKMADGNEKIPDRYYAFMMLAAHDVAAAYKRKYDLENPRPDRYGLHQEKVKLPVARFDEGRLGVSEGERLVMSKDYKSAVEWYCRMWDVVMDHFSEKTPELFGTTHEFSRYLNDLDQLGIRACVFGRVEHATMSCTAQDDLAKACGYKSKGGVCLRISPEETDRLLTRRAQDTR